MISTSEKAAVPKLFRAFSDKTRIRILHLLRGGELCVCDIMSLLRLRQAKTSRHLAYLRTTGLVRSREDGLWTFYELAPARDAVHARLLDCLPSCAEALPEIALDVRRAREHRESGGCCP